jgi:hypothetical protein
MNLLAAAAWRSLTSTFVYSVRVSCKLGVETTIGSRAVATRIALLSPNAGRAFETTAG